MKRMWVVLLAGLAALGGCESFANSQGLGVQGQRVNVR